MLSTRHQKQSTRSKQRKKKPKALENSTPNKVATHLLRLAGNRWLVSLRLGESRQPGEEPTSSTALLLAVMQGEWRQQRRVLSPRGGVTVKAPQQGPTSFCRTEVCSLQHSSGMLQESSQPEMELPVGYCTGQEVWRRAGCTWGQKQQDVAALLNSGNPFGPVCWKLKEYLNRKMTLFKSICNTLSLSMSCQVENN